MLKLSTCLIVLFLLIALSTFSQEIKQENNIAGSYTSLVGGVNLTSFKVTLKNAGQNLSTTSDPALGVFIGYLNNYRFNKLLGAKMGLIASLENGDFMIAESLESPLTNAKMGMLYLKLPIHGQLFIADKFSLTGGMDFDFFLFEIVDGKIQGDESINRYFNPSLSIGADFKPIDRLSIYASYSVGLNNMIKSEYSTMEGLTIKMSKAVIQLGIGIQLGK